MGFSEENVHETPPSNLDILENRTRDVIIEISKQYLANLLDEDIIRLCQQTTHRTFD